jgi:hypothetical protein
MRRLWIAVITTLLVAGCSGWVADGVAHVTFEGREYNAGIPNGYRIEAMDLTPVGTASAAEAPVDGLVVFALEGVDPHEIAVMKAAAGEDAPYLMLFSGDRAIRRPSEVPGLCRYVLTSAVTGCSAQPTQPTETTSLGSSSSAG